MDKPPIKPINWARFLEDPSYVPESWSNCQKSKSFNNLRVPDKKLRATLVVLDFQQCFEKNKNAMGRMTHRSFSTYKQRTSVHLLTGTLIF